MPGIEFPPGFLSDVINPNSQHQNKRQQIDNEDDSNASTSFHVKAEVLLKRKVPKSVATSRLAEVQKWIREQTRLCNWKSRQLNQPSAVESAVSDCSDPNTPIGELFERIMLGSNHVDDSADISNHLSSFVASPSNVHFYKLNSDGPLSQSIGADEEGSIVGSHMWQLPCVEFENIWENLVYDSQIKNEIMSYVYALIQFSKRGVNNKIINVNRLILLLGSPGTGKTSLCKGLVQHLSIRLNNIFTHSVLVEVNSHSLFSKWFSESGKLVQKMFDQVDELAEDGKCLVFLLIDEIESLGMCRETSSARSEPADAIRAVNALLTQIDKVRRRENVLILCTSNLCSSLDSALLDRADLVKKVEVPSHLALYSMLRSCIHEMIRMDIVEHDDELLPISSIVQNEDSLDETSREALSIAKRAVGLSGRAVSMLPTLVYSKAMQDRMSMRRCLELFQEAVDERKSRGMNNYAENA